MLLNKVVLLREGENLKTLAVENNLPYYSQGQKEGRARLKGLAFLKIKDFKELYEAKEYENAKDILLAVVGKNEDFVSVFSRNPLSANRTPYWKGSYVYALMDTFPELDLNYFDFPKIPREILEIYNHDIKLILETLEKHAIDATYSSNSVVARRAEEFLRYPLIAHMRPVSKAIPDLKMIQSNSLNRLLTNLRGANKYKYAKQVERWVKDGDKKVFTRAIKSFITSSQSFANWLGASLLISKNYQQHPDYHPDFKISWPKALDYWIESLFR